MNSPTRCLLPLSLLLLGACDPREQAFEDSSELDRWDAPATRKATSCVTPPDDLVLWHSYDEATGPIAVDHSFGPGSAHGDHVNVTPTLFGQVSSALGFNGSSSAVVVPHEPAIDFSTSDFAVDFWFRPAPGESRAILVGKAIQNPPPSPVGIIVEGWQLSYDGSAVFLSLAGGNAIQIRQLSSLNQPIVEGQWNFIAVNVDRDNQQAQLWLNGVDQGVIGFPFPANSISTNADLTVGNAGVAAATWNFNGTIDELELFTRTLSAAEVASLYNAGPAGKCKDCPPESPTLKYASTDPAVCMEGPPDVYCDPSEGWRPFDNHCGCGCIQEIEDGMQ
ncbi:MAG: LamG domain-containing protein [Deltaproteobacteria bacterium]|nr:LamG domain-containing protein [Deltaproteobacteria bacterium]